MKNTDEITEYISQVTEKSTPWKTDRSTNNCMRGGLIHNSEKYFSTNFHLTIINSFIFTHNTSNKYTNTFSTCLPDSWITIFASFTKIWNNFVKVWKLFLWNLFFSNIFVQHNLEEKNLPHMVPIFLMNMSKHCKYMRVFTTTERFLVEV